MKASLLLHVITLDAKLASLTGRGGNFVIPVSTTKAPVGEFQVNKAVGTVSGLFCDEIKENPSMKMMCSNGAGEDSVCTFLCHQTRTGIGMGSQVCACAKMRRGPIMIPLGCEWKGSFPDCEVIQAPEQPNVIDQESTPAMTSTSITSSTTTTTVSTKTTTPTTSSVMSKPEVAKPYEYARSAAKINVDDLFSTTSSSEPLTTPVHSTTFEQTTLEPTTIQPTSAEPTTLPDTTTTWHATDTSKTTVVSSIETTPGHTETKRVSETTTSATPVTKQEHVNVVRSSSVALNEMKYLPQHIALEAVETALSHFEPKSIEKLKRFIAAFQQQIIEQDSSDKNDSQSKTKVSPSERKLLRQASKLNTEKRYCDNLTPLRNGYLKYTYGLEEGSSALYYCNDGFVIKQRGFSRKCRCTADSCYWSKSPRECIIDEGWCLNRFILTKHILERT